MKAPDKICVAPHQITDYDLDIQEVGHNGAEEYIRKEALIEWIEKEIQALSDGSLSGYYISLAYKDMIEHLNEM